MPLVLQTYDGDGELLANGERGNHFGHSIKNMRDGEQTAQNHPIQLQHKDCFRLCGAPPQEILGQGTGNGGLSRTQSYHFR